MGLPFWVDLLIGVVSTSSLSANLGAPTPASALSAESQLSVVLQSTKLVEKGRLVGKLVVK